MIPPSDRRTIAAILLCDLLPPSATIRTLANNENIVRTVSLLVHYETRVRGNGLSHIVAFMNAPTKREVLFKTLQSNRSKKVRYCTFMRSFAFLRVASSLALLLSRRVRASSLFASLSFSTMSRASTLAMRSLPSCSTCIQ